MKNFTWRGMVLLALMAAGAVGAEPDPAEQPLRLELTLVDGSRVIGAPTIEKVPVETSYAKMDVPLKQIVSITVGDDRETAAIVLQNGDKLKGVITLEPIRLDTIFGAVKIGIEHVRELRVELANHALSGAAKRGLVLHYTFDREEGDKVSDQSEKGNHGMVLGARYTPEGKGGGAYSLSGHDQHITIPNSASLEIVDQLTLAVWVKLDSFEPGGYGNEHGYIINKGDDLWWNPAFCLGFSKSGESGQPFFHVCNATGQQNGGGKSAAGESKLELGVWTHLAGVYDGETVKLYVNGKLEGTEPYSGKLRSDRAPVHLGGGKLFGVDWGNQFTVHGTIDDVMIFDHALTEREIQQVYRATK